MMELLIMMAGLMPEDMLLERMKETLDTYLLTKDGKLKGELLMLATVYVTKSLVTEQAEKDGTNKFEAVIKVMKEMEKQKEVNKLFKDKIN